MRNIPFDDPEYDGLFRAFDAMKQAVAEVNDKKRATEEADFLLRKWNKAAETDKTLKVFGTVLYVIRKGEHEQAFCAGVASRRKILRTETFAYSSETRVGDTCIVQ
jgi:hypothetical protein